MFLEEEDPCIICHEDLLGVPREIQWSCNNCSHRYHILVNTNMAIQLVCFQPVLLDTFDCFLVIHTRFQF